MTETAIQVDPAKIVDGGILDNAQGREPATFRVGDDVLITLAPGERAEVRAVR